jgi:radical SAM superfamily enzyme YgiQ (UPF0313 family)
MKSALITFGNEESYGLLFVGGELQLYHQDIKFFDGEDDFVDSDICEWQPDFIMFSPMTAFYPRALELSRIIKEAIPRAICVFGGHHAMSTPESVLEDGTDIVVVGPVRGSIEKILDGERGIITTPLTSPSDLPIPARSECYNDIPRLGDRYRKFVLSILGCPWNCSYCSSSCGNRKKIFGSGHNSYYLRHRPLQDVMEELCEITRYPTKEIEWVDDDVFAGDEKWLLEFVRQYTKYISLPMYISTTSLSTIQASKKLLKAFAPITSAVGLGVQAARKESLELFNRKWDNEQRMQKAYSRLKSFGFSVNLQAIVGLPVGDPVEDAIDTIKLMQRIGAGSICSVYPLQVYPNTRLEEYCKNTGHELNEASGDTNTGDTGIWFDPIKRKRLKNICKLATMFVKYNVDENWMRALLDVDLINASRNLSLARYHDCVQDRLSNEIFEEIITATKLRY